VRYFIFLSFISVFCCRSSEISVNEVQKYAKAGHAIKSDVNEFFDRRMKNKPRKALVGNWEILYEDEESLYYGYPRFKRIFSDERVVEKVYFLPVKDLEEQFPPFRKLTGAELRLKIYSNIADYRKSKSERLPFTLASNDWFAVLNEKTIAATAKTRIENIHTKERFFQTYELIFDKKNLNLLKLEQK